MYLELLRENQKNQAGKDDRGEKQVQKKDRLDLRG